MKTALLLALLPLLLIGCAGTQVRENGKIVFRTQMNCAEMEFRSPAGSYLKVRGMNHSTPTRAGGSLIGTTGAAMTGVAGALLTNGLVR